MSLFGLFKSKEERLLIELTEKKAHINKKTEEADLLDKELTFFKDQYFMSGKGILYIFLRIQYDEKRDKIQFVVRNGNTPEGMVSVTEFIYFDPHDKLSKDKIRYLEFVESSKRLGLTIK